MSHHSLPRSRGCHGKLLKRGYFFTTVAFFTRDKTSWITSLLADLDEVYPHRSIPKPIKNRVLEDR